MNREEFYKLRLRNLIGCVSVYGDVKGLSNFVISELEDILNSSEDTIFDNWDEDIKHPETW